jgi:glucosylceramidase
MMKKRRGIIISLLALTVMGYNTSQPGIKVDKKQAGFEGKSVTIYQTAKDSAQQFSPIGKLQFGRSRQPLETEVSVFVNPSKTFQSFLGIGGAITDASAEVFAKLPTQKQDEFLSAYFGPEGINYSIIRTNINSCDFSSDSYSYVETGDSELKTFTIDHDKKFKITLIKKAINKVNDSVILFVSPWSPPAFMKDNKNMLHGGKLLPEYYQSWANYFVKFIRAYQAEGLPIWGVSIQNEPMAVQTWESCIYTAEEERDFLKKFLGPTLEKAGLGNINIIVWDHNRDLIVQRANTILEDPDAAKYVWGLGFHWYETWSGGEPKWDNIGLVNEAFPDKKLLFTEGCVEKFSQENFQRWSNAERYGFSMINDFNMGTVGWIDWNILLDEYGGPNHVGNFCFAPIHANTQTGELIYTPSYYYIGHFSKFIRRNARRVSTSTSRSNLSATSFLNENGELVTIVMNATSDKIHYNLYVDKAEVALDIPAHAIQTLICQ